MRNMKKVRISGGIPHPSAFFDFMKIFSGLHSIPALIKSNTKIVRTGKMSFLRNSLNLNFAK